MVNPHSIWSVLCCKPMQPWASLSPSGMVCTSILDTQQSPGEMESGMLVSHTHTHTHTHSYMTHTHAVHTRRLTLCASTKVVGADPSQLLQVLFEVVETSAVVF